MGLQIKFTIVQDRQALTKVLKSQPGRDRLFRMPVDRIPCFKIQEPVLLDQGDLHPIAAAYLRSEEHTSELQSP